MFLNNLICNNKFSVTDFFEHFRHFISRLNISNTLNSRENMNKYSDYKTHSYKIITPRVPISVLTMMVN